MDRGYVRLLVVVVGYPPEKTHTAVELLRRCSSNDAGGGGGGGRYLWCPLLTTLSAKPRSGTELTFFPESRPPLRASVM